ncbi:MAG: hypothetical protein ACRKGH_09510 [Dehalogenimonas sp.]
MRGEHILSGVHIANLVPSVPGILERRTASLGQGLDLPQPAVVAAGSVIAATGTVVAEGSPQVVTKVDLGYLAELIVQS